MRRFLVILLLLAGVAGPVAAASVETVEVPEVLVTLKPLHALVSGVMAGIGTPLLLLGGGSNPHGHAMRPFDRVRLRDADLVVWIGPAFETFLAKPMRGRRTRQLRILNVHELDLLPVRESALWEAGSPAAHEHHGTDPHVWLDPDNAQRIVTAIADTLAEMDVAHSKAYQDNAKKMQLALARMDREIKATLASVHGHAFIVMHDAWQYFEKHYDLLARGALRAAVDRLAGARHISALNKLVKSGEIRCVFSDPRYSDASVKSLATSGKVRTAALDPIGIDIPAGPQAYEKMMRKMAEAIRDCLAD